METKRIYMAVTNDLVTDQRVDRACRALASAGYAVTLVGRRLPGSSRVGERPYAAIRLRLLFRRSALFYAEYNLRLFFRLLRAPADAFYANDTDTLLACTWAARLRRKRLIFDAHELFPEVPELVSKPRVRAVWQHIERRCLPRVDAAFTVCQSVADEYRRRYGVDMAVVRNLPDQLPAPPDEGLRQPGLLLYQGAVNVGRGVRELVDAMEHLPACRLLVAGDGDLLDELRAYAAALPWGSRITFRGRTEPDELHRITPTAEMGFCLLEDLGLNYRFALPNRIGDFARARVPLFATGFPEIARIIGEYGIGTLADPCPHEKSGEAYRRYVADLAGSISSALDSWRRLDPAERSRRFDRAAADLCWENEKNRLLEPIDAILKEKLR